MIDSTVVIAVADREAKKLIVSVARILFPSRVDVANATKLPIRRWVEREEQRERKRENYIYIYEASQSSCHLFVESLEYPARSSIHCTPVKIALRSLRIQTHKYPARVFYASNS